MTIQLPRTFPGVAWTADEPTPTPSSNSTAGVPCETASKAVAHFEPTAGVFTTRDIVPEYYNPRTGWFVGTPVTVAGNAPSQTPFDVTTAARFNFRVDNTAGGTGGTKYTATAALPA